MIFVPEPYQLTAHDFLIGGLERMLIAGMGLGKTASSYFALDTLFRDGALKGALVVAPMRVCNLVWPGEAELWDFTHWMTVVNLRTAAGKRAWERGEAHIYTINYEMLPAFAQKYLLNKQAKDLPVCTVIFDEVSKAKNHASMRINSFRRHRHKFTRFWGLTGTPAPNNAQLDIFAQYRLLDGGKRLGTAYHEYRKLHFMPVDYEQRDWRLLPGHENIIEQRVSDMTLVLRSSDWLDIPDTEVIDIDTTMPEDQWKQYKKLKRDLLLLIDKHEINAINAAVLVNKLLQLTSGAVYASPMEGAPPEVVVFHDSKIQAMKQVVKEQKGEPLLVSFMFRHEEERMRREFPQAAFFSDAKTPRQQMELAEQWNAGLWPILVAHPQSVGHGLNLQHGGADILWFTMTWSRELYDQMNARVARKGQTRTPRIFRLLTPKTMDDAVASILRQKGDDQSLLMNTIHNFQLMSCAA